MDQALLYKRTTSTCVKSASFDLEKELQRHAWRPFMRALDAEKALQGKPQFTYILRPNENGRHFKVSFVNPEGRIEHHDITLINPKYGIFRNYLAHHIGSLEKALRDSMNSGFEDIHPLM